MPRFAADELILIRHAPAATGGRLCGRRDVGLAPGQAAAAAGLAARLAPVMAVVTSPAQRCRATAAALFPGQTAVQDARLWEQDFGAEEGLAPADLPDLGPLPLAALAARTPPGGESFAAMVARAGPALADLAAQARAAGPIAVVAHAGTVRAALALALGSAPATLAFEVAPLSLTRLRCLAGGWSIVTVNGAP